MLTQIIVFQNQNGITFLYDGGHIQVPFGDLPELGPTSSSVSRNSLELFGFGLFEPTQSPESLLPVNLRAPWNVVVVPNSEQNKEFIYVRRSCPYLPAIKTAGSVSVDRH